MSCVTCHVSRDRQGNEDDSDVDEDLAIDRGLDLVQDIDQTFIRHRRETGSWIREEQEEQENHGPGEYM